MSNKKFEVGQLVGYNTGRTWNFETKIGEITKISPAGTLTVTENGGTLRIFKNRKYGGPGVSKLSEHEIAVHQWKKQKPKTSIVWLTSSWGSSTETITLHSNLGSESIEKLIRELKKIQVWLFEKPQDHSAYDESEDD